MRRLAALSLVLCLCYELSKGVVSAREVVSARCPLAFHLTPSTLLVKHTHVASVRKLCMQKSLAAKGRVGLDIEVVSSSPPSAESSGSSAQPLISTTNARVATRRHAIRQTLLSAGVSAAALFSTIAPATSSPSSPSGGGITLPSWIRYDACAAEPVGLEADIARLKQGLKGLTYLLNHWEEETTICNYADVNREVLEAKNKERLLEDAKINVLFDKSGKNLVVSCKRNAAVVREYLGLTANGTPLYKAEVVMRKAVNRIDPDVIEDYLSAVEEWEQLIASANSSAYVSNVGDFDNISNFKQSSGGGGGGSSGGSSYLEQSRLDLVKARKILQLVVDAIEGTNPTTDTTAT